MLTGDRVELAPGDSGDVTTHAAPGREKIGFATVRSGGDTLVIPNDLLELVTSERIELDLFNVSYLLENGYDDASQQDIPLLVTGAASGRGAGVAGDLRSRIASADTTVTRVMPSLGVVAARQRKAAASSTVIAELVRSPDHKLWLDRKLSLSLDHSVQQVGAPVAWANGLTGAGVVVAVLDTGIDATHPDLAGKVIDAQNLIHPRGASTVSLRGSARDVDGNRVEQTIIRAYTLAQ